MWVIEGTFDGEPGSLDEKKCKLLKPGKTYPLGRKSKHLLQIVLPHPKISAEHVTFVVGEHAISDVSDTKKHPTLVLRNHRDKVLPISREVNGVRERAAVQARAELQLCSGDTIALVTGVYVSVHWRPVCCLFQTNISEIPLEKCASLGVKIISTLQPDMTHYMSSECVYTPGLIASLLIPADIVNSDWLLELLRLGESTPSENLSRLETDFQPPSESQYRPPCSPAILPQHRSPGLWELMPERRSLLEGWRILFVGEKGREIDSSTRFLVDTGGGEYEVFDVEGGPTRFRQALTRNARKLDGGSGKHLSIVGDPNRLRIAAGDTWDSMLDVLTSFGLHIVDRQALLNAVLQNEATLLSSSFNGIKTGEQRNVLEDLQATPSAVQSGRSEQPLVNAVTSEQGVSPDEPSPSVLPRSALRKRVTSTTQIELSDRGENGLGVSSHKDIAENGSALSEPSQILGRMSAEPDATLGRRRPLVRRAGTKLTTISLLDADDSAVIEAGPSATEKSSSIPSAEPEGLASSGAIARPSRLKKRVRGDTPLNPILAELEAELVEATMKRAVAEPPLKRFKALFEQTDPDRAESQAIDSGCFGGSGDIVESQMFSQKPTQSAGGRGTEPPLTAISEESGEDQVEAAVQDVEMAGLASPVDVVEVLDANLGIQPVPAEARAKTPLDRQPSNAQFTKPPGSRRHGAAPGKHDTDEAFLKAISSTKKGKRREDDFDREFNKLRISKPELEKEADDWNMLVEFGDETNLRGNFMVIVEMDVTEKRNGRTQGREPEKVGWVGKPDFKKFKKTSLNHPHTRTPVELVVDNENDFGIGSEYWKDGSQDQSQSQDNNRFGSSPFHPSYAKSNRTQNKTQTRNILQATTSRSNSQSNMGSYTMQPMNRPKSRQPREIESEDDDFNETESVGRSTYDKKGALGGKRAGDSQIAQQPLFLSTLEEQDEDEGRLEDVHDASTVRASTIGEDTAEVDLNLFPDDEVFTDEDPIYSTTRPSGQAAMAASKLSAGSAASRAGSNAKRSTKLLDDDVGDTFKGFTGRKRKRTRIR